MYACLLLWSNINSLHAWTHLTKRIFWFFFSAAVKKDSAIEKKFKMATVGYKEFSCQICIRIHTDIHNTYTILKTPTCHQPPLCNRINLQLGTNSATVGGARLCTWKLRISSTVKCKFTVSIRKSKVQFRLVWNNSAVEHRRAAPRLAAALPWRHLHG